MIPFVLVYLLMGSWTALALSFYGRMAKGQRMAALMALGIVLLWPLVWLDGMAQAFGEDTLPIEDIYD